MCWIADAAPCLAGPGSVGTTSRRVIAHALAAARAEVAGPDKGAAQRGAARRGLTHVDVSSCPDLSDAGVQQLLGPLSCVRSLNLARCVRLSLKGLSFQVRSPVWVCV